MKAYGEVEVSANYLCTEIILTIIYKFYKTNITPIQWDA
jgi:hypothetical protein